MQRRVPAPWQLAAAFLTLLALSASPVEAQQRPSWATRDGPPELLENFTFEERTFASEAVGAEQPYGLYLPIDYDKAENAERRYPLIIWLHGMFENHMRFHNRGGAPYLDKAVTDGVLPPCIFVCANGGRRSMYVNNGDQRWEDLITVDLLAHLEKEFRVSDKRQERALMGVSMGGMAALRIGLTKPDLFGAISVHSSAVFPEDPDDLPPRLAQFASRLGFDEVLGKPIKKDVWKRINPLNIAIETDPKTLKGLRIRFDCGDKDRYGFHQGNELLHRAMKKRGIEHEWRLIKGGSHSWGHDFQHEALPPSFEMVGKALRAADAARRGLKGLGGDRRGKGGK